MIVLQSLGVRAPSRAVPGALAGHTHLFSMPTTPRPGPICPIPFEI